MIAATGGASEPPNMRLPGKAGGTVAVRRTLASTICRIANPTQASRPRQLRDASTVMRFRPAHQSMINRRFNRRASCPARKSPKQALARKPRIHSPASGKGGHESGTKLTLVTVVNRPDPRSTLIPTGTFCLNTTTTRAHGDPSTFHQSIRQRRVAVVTGRRARFGIHRTRS